MSPIFLLLTLFPSAFSQELPEECNSMEYCFEDCSITCPEEYGYDVDCDSWCLDECEYCFEDRAYQIEDLLWTAYDEEYALENEIWELDDQIHWYRFGSEKKNIKAEKEAKEVELEDVLYDISYYEDAYAYAEDDLTQAGFDRNTIQATLDVASWMGPIDLDELDSPNYDQVYEYDHDDLVDSSYGTYSDPLDSVDAPDSYYSSNYDPYADLYDTQGVYNVDGGYGGYESGVNGYGY